MATQDKLPLWDNGKKNASYALGICKRLEVELPDHPGRFDQIIYWPGIIEIPIPHLSQEGEVEFFLQYFDHADMTLPTFDCRALIDDKGGVVRHEAYLCNFTGISERLTECFEQNVKYLHILVKQRLTYLYEQTTFIVVPQDHSLPIGYASDSPLLDDAGKRFIDDLFYEYTIRKTIEVFKGKTFITKSHEQEIA